MINELVHKNNINNNIFDFYKSFKKIRRLILANFKNFFDNLEKEKLKKKLNQSQIFENEQNSSNLENDESNQKNKENSSNTDNDKEKEIENKSDIISFINNSDKKHLVNSENGNGSQYKSISDVKNLEKIKNDEISNFSEYVRKSENNLFLNYIKENKSQFMIISKLISKVIKTKNENSDSNSISKNNFEKKDNQDFENNKSNYLQKIRAQFGKLFNIFLMNSKIIDNENETHNTKITFFLKEIILFFFQSFFDNFKDKINLEFPRELLKMIVNILLEYEVDCDSILQEFQLLLEKMNFVLLEEEKNKIKLKEKLNLKNRVSTNKKK